MSEISEYEPIDVRIPILHPDELDRKLEDKTFTGRIAAVTTTSIDVVRKLIRNSTSNFSVYDSGYINIDLVDDVYDELTERNKKDKISPTQTITYNADDYGKTQAAIGLLSEKGVPSDKIGRLLATWEFAWFAEMAPKDFSDEELDTKLSNYKGISSYLNYVWSKTQPAGSVYYGDAERVLRDVFPRAREVARYLKKLRSRNGVQLILGNKEKFSDFVLDNRSEEIDTSGIRLHADIPRNLILGIVPRGNFEQKELMGV
jgi:hypothetical protein